MRIEVVHPDSVSDADLLKVYEIDKEIEVEAKPDLPTRRPDAWLASQRVERPGFHRAYALARVEDSLVGVGWMGWMTGEANRHLARAHVSVPASRRRQGLGRALLAALAAHANDDGRTLLQSWTSSNAPSGEAFCRAAGATPGMTTHHNRLSLAALDRGLLERWVRAGEVLTDYELLAIVPPTPAELLPQAAEIANVMNTAPRDDLREEDETMTPELYAAGERAHLAGGRGGRRLYVRHRPTGKLVGLTEIGWDEHDRSVIAQGDTGVLPEHRGHGLGKLLKAAMLLWVLQEIPEARTVITGNAVSNEPMLAINFALGFEPVGSWTVWELDVDRVL